MQITTTHVQKQVVSWSCCLNDRNSPTYILCGEKWTRVMPMCRAWDHKKSTYSCWYSQFQQEAVWAVQCIHFSWIDMYCNRTKAGEKYLGHSFRYFSIQHVLLAVLWRVKRENTFTYPWSTIPSPSLWFEWTRMKKDEDISFLSKLSLMTLLLMWITSVEIEEVRIQQYSQRHVVGDQIERAQPISFSNCIVIDG